MEEKLKKIAFIGDIMIVFPKEFIPPVMMLPHTSIEVIRTILHEQELNMAQLHNKLFEVFGSDNINHALNQIICSNHAQLDKECILKLSARPFIAEIKDWQTYPPDHPDKHRFGTEQKKFRAGNNRKKTKYRSK